ncbi:MAG: histidine phosphatase family protein [Candidatus Thorarchaeota archaeon]|jgi:broad specificity phosphatase PhoE
MLSRITILRHAETKINIHVPVENWFLTDEGIRKSQELADTGMFDDIDRIFTSNDYKTHATALPVAERLGLDIEQVPNLSELYRGASPLMSDEDYLDCVSNVLSFPPQQVGSWENPENALQRFRTSIEEISQKGANTLVVSHGLVISLFFADRLGQRNLAFERWKRLGFLSWGIVSKGEVRQDIV